MADINTATNWSQDNYTEIKNLTTNDFKNYNYTAFGIYDEDQRFIAEASGVSRYIVRSLGYPHINVQLMPQHILTSFQAAAMKYSTIVNQSKISDNLLNMFGTKISDTQDVSTAAVYQNVGSLLEISSMYGQEAIIKSSLNVPIYTSSLNVVAGQQEYDLTTVIPQVGNKNVQLVQVYYYPKLYDKNIDVMTNGVSAASIASGFGGVISQNARMTIMPLFQSLLRMQHLQMSQQIRRAHFGFQIRMNKILFYPAPQTSFKVDIDYLLKSDKRLNTIKQDAVNNVSNFPINDYLRYDSINTPGRNWIQRFTLALCKELLGLIRSKFSSIPYTQNQMSMDGESLRSQGVQQQDKLIEELKTQLQESSMFRLVQKKSQMSQHLQTINSKIPSRIFVG